VPIAVRKDRTMTIRTKDDHDEDGRRQRQDGEERDELNDPPVARPAPKSSVTFCQSAARRQNREAECQMGKKRAEAAVCARTPSLPGPHERSAASKLPLCALRCVLAGCCSISRSVVTPSRTRCPYRRADQDEAPTRIHGGDLDDRQPLQAARLAAKRRRNAHAAEPEPAQRDGQQTDEAKDDSNARRNLTYSRSTT
jgi:hypothetical protein